MEKEQIVLQVLTEQQEEISSYKTKKWIFRNEEKQFEWDSPLAQVVIGVRRSGKSTLCHKTLIEHKIDYAYVNFDDDRLADLTASDLNMVLSCIYQLYGTDIQYIFLDEAQNVEGWHLFVNRLLRNGVHMFVTGSNAKLLSSELATYLTGRYNEIRLYPFSFREYCDFHQIDIHGFTTKAEAERKAAFMDYANNGGFPEMQSMRNKRGYIQSLMDAIIRKDISKRFKVRNIAALQKIANHLINNACREVNYDGLSEILGLTDKTIKKYVEYLHQAFLVQLLTKFSYKSKERIRNQKAYIIDSGLQNNRENALAAENLGWRLENIVYIDLLRRCAEKFFDVYYYKPNSSAKEIDFVICNQDRPVELIQVAYEIDSPKAFNRETSSLVKAADALKCDNLTLVAFTQSRDIETEGKTIHIFSALDWLLKQD